MNINSHPQIENIIRAYLDTRERFIYFGKKKLDAEKSTISFSANMMVVKSSILLHMRIISIRPIVI